jgi:tetratricopeptide (TPR) repeat protein
MGLPPVPNVRLSPSELEGHADLGVAYKEMGLYEQAIVEFRALESAPSRAVFAMTMTGECLEKLGRLSEAAALYKRALNTEGVKDAETVVLYHGLGRTFEGLGDLTEARYFYEKVLRRDPSFKDAAARLATLQGALRRPEKHVK